jgi:hypothetical protein
VEPGHPYLTKAFDEQRSRHRRLLRSLPDSMVNRLAPTSRLDPNEGEEHPVEAALRDLADEFLAGNGAEVAQLLRSYGEHTSLDLTARRLQYVVAEESLGSPQETAVSWAVHELQDRAVARNTRQIPEEHLSGVALVIGLLCHADEAAGDYRDPRLQDQSDR